MPGDLVSRFEDFREEHDLNQTDALKRLVETGLDERESGAQGQNPQVTFASDASRTLGVVLCGLALWSLFSASRAQVTFVLAAAGIVMTGVAYRLRTCYE